MRVREFYRRWRTLIGEAWRFALVGGFNVGINFVMFNALVIVMFGGSELKANVVATAVATTSSYLMNRSWTFRHRRTSRIPREYVLFFLFNGAALGIELAVMGLAKYGLGLTALWALNLAKLAGLGIGTVFRFWTYRTFVFAGRQPAADPVTSPVSHGPNDPSAADPATNDAAAVVKPTAAVDPAGASDPTDTSDPAGQPALGGAKLPLRRPPGPAQAMAGPPR